MIQMTSSKYIGTALEKQDRLKAQAIILDCIKLCQRQLLIGPNLAEVLNEITGYYLLEKKRIEYEY